MPTSSASAATSAMEIGGVPSMPAATTTGLSLSTALNSDACCYPYRAVKAAERSASRARVGAELANRVSSRWRPAVAGSRLHAGNRSAGIDGARLHEAQWVVPPILCIEGPLAPGL